MAWFPVFRLGPVGGELDFVCQVLDATTVEDDILVEQRNLAGANSRGYLRHNVPSVTLTLARLSDGLLAVLRGFKSSLAPLNFIFNSSLAVKYLMGTSATTISIVIPPTSATGIVITGVYLQSDYAQSGTEYFGAGSFDPTTGTITLANPLPGANTDVWINYTFTGLSCWAKVTSAKPHQGAYSGFWQATLTLTGN